MAGGHGGIVFSGSVMLKETNLIERDFFRWVAPAPVPVLLAGALHFPLVPVLAALPGAAPINHAALRAVIPGITACMRGSVTSYWTT